MHEIPENTEKLMPALKAWLDSKSETINTLLDTGMKRKRDLAIDGAAFALLRSLHPTLTTAEIYAGCSMEIGSGYYAVLFRGVRIASVDLHSEDRFSITIYRQH